MVSPRCGNQPLIGVDRAGVRKYFRKHLLRNEVGKPTSPRTGERATRGRCGGTGSGHIHNLAWLQRRRIHCATIRVRDLRIQIAITKQRLCDAEQRVARLHGTGRT